MGHSKSTTKREIHSITGLAQEARKNVDKQYNFILKGIEKEQQTTPKVSRRKQIIKIREEINKAQSKNNTKDQ